MNTYISWQDIAGGETDSGDYKNEFDSVQVSNITNRSATKVLNEIPEVKKPGYFLSGKEDNSLWLNQDEFFEKSDLCTLYGNFAQRSNDHGKNIPESVREDFISWMDERKIVGPNYGAPVLKTSLIWQNAVKEILGVKCKTYICRAGSRNMFRLMNYHNVAFVGAFVISEKFRTDRKGDMIIESGHGGKEYGGHAHIYETVKHKGKHFLLCGNSYQGREDNHFALKGNYGNKYNGRFSQQRDNGKRYVREYCITHVYE